MGLADRPYGHPWGCSCIRCKEAFEEEEAKRAREGELAAIKYRKDREFNKTLSQMMRQGVVCKHSRLLSDGEKWEDTFCNLLDITCHIVQGDSCCNEELIPIVKEEDNPPA
jgi:hypothetical protein